MTCEFGIEVFRTLDGPHDIKPGLAQFPGKPKPCDLSKATLVMGLEAGVGENVEQDQSKGKTKGRPKQMSTCEDEETAEPRLDIAKTLASCLWLVQHYRDHFKDADGATQQWTQWAETHPTCVEEVPVEDQPMWKWPAACSTLKTNLPHEMKTQALTFAESIEYHNVINGTRVTEAQVAANLSELGPVKTYTPQTKGTYLWIEPDADGATVSALMWSRLPPKLDSHV